jgi:hypothetical protein
MPSHFSSSKRGALFDPASITCTTNQASYHPAPMQLQRLERFNRRHIFAPLSGLTTECDLRPASSTWFPERLFCIAESPRGACLWPCPCLTLNLNLTACLLNVVGSIVFVIVHAGAAHCSRTEICENFHADMGIATAKSAILSSHQLSLVDGLVRGL